MFPSPLLDGGGGGKGLSFSVSAKDSVSFTLRKGKKRKSLGADVTILLSGLKRLQRKKLPVMGTSSNSPFVHSSLII